MTAEVQEVQPAKRQFRHTRRTRALIPSLSFLLFMVAGCLVIPLVSRYSPEEQNLVLGPTSPGVEHWFGTDYEGRDVFTRVWHGGRISLLVGVVATFVSLVLGISVGAAAGWFGGRVDALLMRIVDILYGLPYMFFVIILMVWFGRSLINVFIGLGAVSWLTMARIVRTQVITLARREFVISAQLSGGSAFYILWRHILPNAAGPILVYTSLTVPRVMLEEAFLSFLGLGVQPPLASWGSLVAEGAGLYREYPWLLFFPGVMIALTLLALNVMGDTLQDLLDPKGQPS